MDLDFWNCFGRRKPVFNQRNTALTHSKTFSVVCYPDNFIISQVGTYEAASREGGIYTVWIGKSLFHAFQI